MISESTCIHGSTKTELGAFFLKTFYYLHTQTVYYTSEGLETP